MNQWPGPHLRPLTEPHNEIRLTLCDAMRRIRVRVLGAVRCGARSGYWAGMLLIATYRVVRDRKNSTDNCGEEGEVGD